MRKRSVKKYLLKTNLLFTFLLIVVNSILFFISNGDKAWFATANVYTALFILFVYYFCLSSMYKDKLADLKKEAMFINYPMYISVFIVLIALMLIASWIALYIVNKDVLNAAFVFTFFLNSFFSVFPSFIFLLTIYFIIPEFVLPSVNIKDVKDTKRIRFSKILFAIYICVCIYNTAGQTYKHITIENLEKYKAARITVHFAKKYLKFDEKINNYSKKKLAKETVNIPFSYTQDPIAFANYEDAKSFCQSIDARLANYIEAYYIAFNKSDTFGNKYYWSANSDGDFPLVLHFENMSYTIERYTKDTKPLVYCVSDITSKYGTNKQHYFYKNVQQEKASFFRQIMEKPFDKKDLNQIIAPEKTGDKTKENLDIANLLAAEKKHVDFSVKEVPQEVFNQLLQKGYTYNPSISIKRDYETNDFYMQQRLNKDSSGKNIRLCYFPFANYDGMSLYEEASIYKQSFCSPAFELITQTPAIKTKYEKDAYCYSRGGRLPNIPELYGILKTFGNAAPGIKYWTNNQISTQTGGLNPVLVYNEDERFVNVKAISQAENDSAYVYCIKKAENPSRVVANYKSRFEGIEGGMLAKQKCPNCIYYEMPDVILKR